MIVMVFYNSHSFCITHMPGVYVRKFLAARYVEQRSVFWLSNSSFYVNHGRGLTTESPLLCCVDTILASAVFYVDIYWERQLFNVNPQTLDIISEHASKVSIRICKKSCSFMLMSVMLSSKKFEKSRSRSGRLKSALPKCSPDLVFFLTIFSPSWVKIFLGHRLSFVCLMRPFL